MGAKATLFVLVALTVGCGKPASTRPAVTPSTRPSATGTDELSPTPLVVCLHLEQLREKGRGQRDVTLPRRRSECWVALQTLRDERGGYPELSVCTVEQSRLADVQRRCLDRLARAAGWRKELRDSSMKRLRSRLKQMTRSASLSFRHSGGDQWREGDQGKRFPASTTGWVPRGPCCTKGCSAAGKALAAVKWDDLRTEVKTPSKYQWKVSSSGVNRRARSVIEVRGRPACLGELVWFRVELSVDDGWKVTVKGPAEVKP